MTSASDQAWLADLKRQRDKQQRQRDDDLMEQENLRKAKDARLQDEHDARKDHSE